MYSIHVKVFIEFENKILILKQNRNNKWHLPGGNTEDGESFEDTCHREILEECGINITQLYYLYSENFEYNKKQYIRVQFEAVSNNNKIKLSTEHNDFIWVKADEINKYEFAFGEKERIIKYFNKHIS